MTVAEMIAQRTVALRKVLNDCAVAVDAKGGTPADDLSGLQDAIVSIPTGGVVLPELTTPAEVGHVLAGKEYIDGNGDKKSGTLVVCESIEEAEHFGIAGTGVSLEIESTADGSNKKMTLPEPNLKSENIVAGSSIFGVPGTAKKLRVETGTITPAEDAVYLTLPCTANPKMIVVHMTDASLETVVREDMVAAMRANLTGVPYELGTDSSVASVFVTNLQYHNTGGKRGAINSICTLDPVKITGSSTYQWRAGLEYRWTAYYWEDDA